MTSENRDPPPDSERKSAGGKPDSAYRSRKAVVQQRIAGLEGELGELRAELDGLPAVRTWRSWAILGGFTAIALVALGVIFMMRRPDTFKVTETLSSAGWALTFEFTHPIQCIDVIAIGRDGKQSRVDCITSSTLPNVANAALTMDQARTRSTLTVEYEVEGSKRQVMTVFEPMAAQIDQVKHALTIVGQWVEGRDYQGKRLLYFTSLLTYGFVLDEIRYGFDDGPLDQTVRFQPRDKIGILNEDELYRSIPESVDSVNIQLTFIDGTTMSRKVPIMPR